MYANNTLAMLERPEAAGAFEACMADAHRRGSLFGVSAARLWRGYDYLRRGELADAESDLNTVMGDFEAWGAADDMVKTYLAAFLALTLLERGQPDAAWAALDAAAVKDGTDGARFWLDSRAALLVATGRPEEALAVTDELAGPYGWVVAPSATPVALHPGARRSAGWSGPRRRWSCWTRSWRWPARRGRPARSVASCAPAERSRATRTRCARRSRCWRARPRGWSGRARPRPWARWLRRERRPSDAREPLRRALELAEACGAEALAADVRTELRASGARPRSTRCRASTR